MDSSSSMINLAKLEHPFAYTIEVLTDDGPRTQPVDLVETFNLAYGLHVQRLETWANDAEQPARKYRVVKGRDRDGRKRVLVVWRDMAGLDPKAERQFLEARVQEAGPFEEMWINGDCAVPGFASLDGLFKRLIEEGER